MVLTILKILVVLGFFVYFLRRPSFLSGIGLLTVATAVLLDTLIGTFNREETIAQLGFFFYVLSGLIVAGAAIWLVGVTRPLWGQQPLLQNHVTELKSPPIVTKPAPALVDELNDTPIDKQMLYDEMHTRLGFDDLLDLMYDLQIYENYVMQMPQPATNLIVNIMDYAEANGLNHQLALAVERIITPPPPDHMPRLDKITIESPPTILRHFLLANYSFDNLIRLANVLNVDWEQLSRHNKKMFVRELLLHLERRNETPQLIATMHDMAQPEG